MEGNSRKLAIGTKVLFDGETCTVQGFENGAVRLRSYAGKLFLLSTRELVGAEDFEVLEDFESNVDKPSDVLLHTAEIDDLAPEVRKEAEKRRDHLNEAITGYPSGKPGVPEAFSPRSEYDPSETTITERMATKARELGMSQAGLWKSKKKYEKSGLYGLVDKRKLRPLTSADRLDPRVREAVFAVLDELTDKSNATRTRIVRKTKAYVIRKHGSDTISMPSDRTLRRVVEELTVGRGTFGSAKARRSIANRPKPTYRQFMATRPGEVVSIDTTRLDVFAVDPLTLGCVQVELTLALDMFTRSIVGWRFTPYGTTGLDAALLLHDIITPKAMKPGWPETARWAYCGVPETILLDAFDVKNVAAIPTLHPESVVVDHGKIYESVAFLRACNMLGINVQSARPYKATDKPQIERIFLTIRQTFLENLPGYKGPDVWSRGSMASVEKEAFYFIDELDDLFAEYVVRHYQNRPHKGLQMPGAPKYNPSPNEMYDMGLATTGFVYVPPTPDVYYELLPIKWCKIHNNGIWIDRLRYDGDALNDFRHKKFHYAGKHKGKWAISYDPRDRSRAFFKDPRDGDWHELEWVHAPRNVRPFGNKLLSYAKLQLIAREGHASKYTPEELGDVLEEIFERIEQDRMVDPKERRAAARAAMQAPHVARDRGLGKAPLPVDETADGVGDADGWGDEGQNDVWNIDPASIDAFPVFGDGPAGEVDEGFRPDPEQ